MTIVGRSPVRVNQQFVGRDDLFDMLLGVRIAEILRRGDISWRPCEVPL
jgi:hypothetical protein